MHEAPAVPIWAGCTVGKLATPAERSRVGQLHRVNAWAELRAGRVKKAGDRLVAVLGALFAQRSTHAEVLLVKVASIRPFGLSAWHALRRRSPPLLAKYCSKLVHQLGRPQVHRVGGRHVKILEIF
jgi:hypothetical protein